MLLPAPPPFFSSPGGGDFYVIKKLSLRVGAHTGVGIPRVFKIEGEIATPVFGLVRNDSFCFGP